MLQSSAMNWIPAPVVAALMALLFAGPAGHSGQAPRAADGSSWVLPAGACLVATGPAGDGLPAGTQSPGAGVDEQALDLLNLAFSSDVKAGTLTAYMNVVSLNDNPAGGTMVYEDGDIWIAQFGTNSGNYYLEAQYGNVLDFPATVTPPFTSTFTFGHYKSDPTFGQVQVQDGSATGKLDLSTNTVVVTVPYAKFNLAPGQVAGSGLASTQADNYTGSTVTDTGMANSADYIVGSKTCLTGPAS